MSQIFCRARKSIICIPSRGSKCLTLYHEVVLGFPCGELKLLNIEFCLPMCDVSGIIDDQADCNDEVDAADGVQVWPLTQFSARIGFCDQPPLKGLRSLSSSRVLAYPATTMMGLNFRAWIFHLNSKNEGRRSAYRQTCF